MQKLRDLEIAAIPVVPTGSYDRLPFHVVSANASRLQPIFVFDLEILPASPPWSRINTHSPFFSTGPVRFDGNIAESLKAEEPYPLSTIVGSDLASSLHAGRYQDAINELEKTLTMEPGLVPAHGYLSEAYSILGNAAKAAGEREKALRRQRRVRRHVH